LATIAAISVSIENKVVHVKLGISKGLLIHKVNPSYPQAARDAHIEGTVVLCASISKEGRIENLTAASGPPELIPSSIKAVKKWRYKPYLLNGEPVVIHTEIRVNYTLAR
jgi:protein TonB